MKEEIERRRAEAAEKRQKEEDSGDGEERPFKCVSPRGSSLKVSPFLDSRPPSSSCGGVLSQRLLGRNALDPPSSPPWPEIKDCRGDGTFNGIKSESRLRPRRHSN